MLLESRMLIANYDKYFKRLRQTQYYLVVVNNHYFETYSFFMQVQKLREKLHYSHVLMEMPRDEEKYNQVMKDLRTHTQMRIEFRDTHNLVHPGRDIDVDLGHGHGHSTRYRPES